MRNRKISPQEILFGNKDIFQKVGTLLLICGYIFALVGCTNQESNNISETQGGNKVIEVQENNKFIGAWNGGYKNGNRWFCCISPSGVGYVGNVQSGTHEMDVEEKTTYEYKIEGDTIYLENVIAKHSFQLQGDDLIGDDGEKYSRSRTSITIYRKSEDGDSSHQFILEKRRPHK